MNDTNSIAWLGLDAHSKNCVLGQLDDHGTEIKGWGFPTKPEQLIKHVQAIPATDLLGVIIFGFLARCHLPSEQYQNGRSNARESNPSVASSRRL